MRDIINFKHILFFSTILGLFFYTNAYCQTSYIAKDVKINLFSSTPLEDIKAQSTQGYSVIVPKTKQIVFQLAIKSLVFERPLMQEHFNENYMESDKFANATFKGIIDDNIDFTKDGSYNVTVNGVLTVHGIAKQRSIMGKIDIINAKPSIISTFDVLCEDHKIKIPKLVFKKIAEKINITVKSNYN